MRKNAGKRYLNPKEEDEGKKKIRFRLPKLLKKEEILALLRKSKDPQLSMCIFMAVFQGLRLGEMTHDERCPTPALKWENVDLRLGEITILNGKNTHRFENGDYGKDRVVPLFKQFIPVFKMWRTMNPDAEHVFVNPFDTTRPMFKRTIQDRYNTLIASCGLLIADRYGKDGKPRNKYPFHNLRHNCGTQLIRQGMPLPFVQKFMGHSDISTTMIYIDLVKDDIRLELDKGYRKALAINGYAPKQPVVKMQIDKETLLLQKDILEKQLELQRMQQFAGVRQHELLPQQEI